MHILLLICMLIWPAAGFAQQSVPAPAVPAQAEQDRSLAAGALKLLDRQNDLEGTAGRIDETAQRLKELASETEAILPERPALSILQDFRTRWNGELSLLRKSREQIEGYRQQVEEQQASLQAREAPWQATLREAPESRLPAALTELVNTTLGILSDSQSLLAGRLNQLLELQARLSDLQAICDRNLEAIIAAERASLFSFDSPPLWTALLPGESGAELLHRVNETLGNRTASMKRYVGSESRRIVAQAAFFLVLCFALSFLARRVRQWEKDDDLAAASIRVLGRPVSAALLMTLAFTSVFHPHGPSIFRSLAFLLMLVPLLFLLGGIQRLRVRHAIYVLAFLFLLDRGVDLVSYRSLAGRLLLLLLAVLVWLALAVEIRILKRKHLSSFGWRAVSFIATILSAAVFFSVAANVIGSVGLASALADGTLSALYLAIVVSAAVLILRGIVVALLRTGALSRLRAVALHGAIIRQKLDRGINWLGALAWVFGALAGFSVLRPSVEYARLVLTRALPLGRISISLGDILSFILVIWLSILASRLVRFFLQEEVFPRITMARGIPGTISRLTHYAIVALGFVIAISAAGFGLDRVTVLAGAFGVGIGFGLQDIVKNFVAGLVLLFERPIKVGDQIQLENLLGNVKEIGIRASTVRTFEGADVIVPNANLLANQVINWTFADPQRRIDVSVGVAYGTDPEKVMRILRETAESHPDTLKEPAPSVLFLGFGASSLDFSVRAWTERTDKFLQVKSALSIAINNALKEAGIEIPFPQRDLHLRSIDPGVKKMFKD